MDRNRVLSVFIGIILLVATLLFPPVQQVQAQSPPDITAITSQVTVGSDGHLDIKYQLTFHETVSRDRIKAFGPLDEGHTILEASLDYDGTSHPVTLVSNGTTYAVPFGMMTQADKDYTLSVHFTVNQPLDTTTYEGKDYRVVLWAPPQWNIPVGEQTVTFILPVELPSSIKEPEQVTDEVVNQAGVIADTSTTSDFDRWVYYPTPDTTTGKSWLSIHVSSKNLSAQAPFVPKFYVPDTYFPGAAVGGTAAPPSKPMTTGEMITYLLLCIVLPALVIIGGILLVIGFFTRKKVAPVADIYQSPEIVVETYQQQGVVPDLDAIEAALLIGDTAKVLTLVIMGLSRKGAITVLNNKPIQLEVNNADAATEDYEKALVSGVEEDGTIPKATIDRLMGLLNARLQAKMWNADPKATRENYRKRADSAWQTYRSSSTAGGGTTRTTGGLSSLRAMGTRAAAVGAVVCWKTRRWLVQPTRSPQWWKGWQPA